MRRFLHVSTMMAVAATLLVLTAPMATAQDVFTGTWTSIDTDGSNQTIVIYGTGQRGRHAITYFDDAATSACGGAPARLQGSGVVEGDTLFWSSPIICPGTGKGPVIGRVDLFLTHDETTDTLFDGSVDWHRVT